MQVIQKSCRLGIFYFLQYFFLNDLLLIATQLKVIKNGLHCRCHSILWCWDYHMTSGAGYMSQCVLFVWCQSSNSQT